MPIIKPISDLRNKSNEISKLLHESDEPIYITKNGEGDMVLLSIDSYNRIDAKLKLLDKLAEAQSQKLAGDKGKPLSQVMKNVRESIREQKEI